MLQAGEAEAEAELLFTRGDKAAAIARVGLSLSRSLSRSLALALALALSFSFALALALAFALALALALALTLALVLALALALALLPFAPCSFAFCSLLFALSNLVLLLHAHCSGGIPPCSLSGAYASFVIKHVPASEVGGDAAVISQYLIGLQSEFQLVLDAKDNDTYDRVISMIGKACSVLIAKCSIVEVACTAPKPFFEDTTGGDADDAAETSSTLAFGARVRAVELGKARANACAEDKDRDAAKGGLRKAGVAVLGSARLNAARG